MGVFFCLDGLSTSTSHLPNQDHYHKNDGLCTCFVCFTHKEAKLHIGNKWALKFYLQIDAILTFIILCVHMMDGMFHKNAYV
jgi:hypothetical protein